MPRPSDIAAEAPPRTRIESEKRIIGVMVHLYCRRRLHTDTLPPEFAELLDYAQAARPLPLRRSEDLVQALPHPLLCPRQTGSDAAGDALVRTADAVLPPPHHPEALSASLRRKSPVWSSESTGVHMSSLLQRHAGSACISHPFTDNCLHQVTKKKCRNPYRVAAPFVVS